MKLTKGKKQRKRNKKIGTKSVDKLLHFSLIKMDFFFLKMGVVFLKEENHCTHLLGIRNLRELKDGNLILFIGQLTI